MTSVAARRSFAGPARNFDWLVVGAGLTGATLAERIASQLGQRVLVVDRRPHLAGNAHDEVDEDGIRVQRYGPHVFHTGSETVWRYLSQFTDWRPYEHRVLAEVDGRLVPLPCNLHAVAALVGREEGAACTRALVDAFGLGARVPVLCLMEHHDPRLAELGRVVHDALFANDAAKQWGRRPEELDPAITDRMMVKVSRDDRFFRDPYQALPADGYTTMVTRMLDHQLITVATATDHRSLGAHVRFHRTVFTGPIDEYFGEHLGPLPYRSVRFEDEWLARGPYQPVSVVEHPDRHDVTRIVEHAHFEGGPGAGPTLVTREHPEEHRPGQTEPLYPLAAPWARWHHERYVQLAAEEAPATVFAGRLATYRNLDMDQAVGHALQVFTRRICPQLVAVS